MVLHFIIKETRHIVRDRRTVLVLFGMPVVMMLLFGFAISTDIKRVRTVVVTSSMDNATQRLIDRLGASEHFDITCTARTTAEAERMIRSRQADMAIAFTPNFANHRHDRTAAVQLILDAADPNTANMQANYARMTLADGALPVVVNTKMLYNPRMKSSYNFVPGIMGMLLMLICAMMTSVSIVREKERGTMDLLLVSPVKPITIIIAKAVPYLVLAVLILVCIVLLATCVLSVPMTGNVGWIFAVSVVYILLALSLGMLISVVAETQLVALLASAMLLLMPTLLLSGMIYPTESMPTVLRWLSCAMPALWYISAMRKLMIMGVGITSVLREVIILSAMALALLAVALRKFESKPRKPFPSYPQKGGRQATKSINNLKFSPFGES